MLIKLIQCEILPNQIDRFSQGQLAWSALKTAPGFRAQCGGFTIQPNQAQTSTPTPTPTRAIILAFWNSPPEYQHFMANIHDQIFDSTNQAGTYNPKNSSTTLYQTSHSAAQPILDNLDAFVSFTFEAESPDDQSNTDQILRAHPLLPTDSHLHIRWQTITTTALANPDPNLVQLKNDWLVRAEKPDPDSKRKHAKN